MTPTAPRQGVGARTAPLRWLAGSWTLASWVWAAAIVWAPTGAVGLEVESASGRAPFGSSIGRAAVVSVYAVGARVCHQRAERSFHRHDVQFPVCARCTGIYLSLGVGVLLGWWRRPSRRLQPHRVRWAMAAAAAPIALSLAVEWTGIFEPSNIARAVSAVPISLYLGWLAIALLAPRGDSRYQTPSIAGQTL